MSGAKDHLIFLLRFGLGRVRGGVARVGVVAGQQALLAEGSGQGQLLRDGGDKESPSLSPLIWISGG